MTLIYKFELNERPIYRDDWDVDYDSEQVEFEYDVSYEDLKKFYNELSKVDFIDAIKHAIKSRPEEEVKEYFKEYLKEDNSIDYDKVFNDTEMKEDVITDFLFEDEDYLEDDMKDYFYYDAKEEFDNTDYE